MSTHSQIAYQREAGVIVSMYCHWDGYPSHHYRILTNHYNNEVKALRLVNLGALSSLGIKIGKTHEFDRHQWYDNKEDFKYSPDCPWSKGWCCSYKRDDPNYRGKDIDLTYHKSANSMCREDGEFFYLFTLENKWEVYVSQKGRARKITNQKRVQKYFKSKKG